VNATVSLDELSAEWRLALDAAGDAMRAASQASVRLPELGERTNRLEQERNAVSKLLEAIARDEHVELHHRLGGPAPTRTMLGLPTGVRAAVFTLDGVLIASAVLHATAWAETFDEFLWHRFQHTGDRFGPFRPFNRITEYEEHIHAKPRLAGIHGFLASRGISIPEGEPDDPAGAETVNGLGNRKKEILRELLEREGVTAFAGSRRYLEDARQARLPFAVVSASENTAAILERSGLADLVEYRVDGQTIRAAGLRPKPAPDTLLAACRLLGVEPNHAAAFETTVAGIAAARAAGFAHVVGVDRSNRGEPLRASGADVVITDLVELLDPALAA
jgi:HAD superfamily hydrolase (TIGR01509 family)